MSPRQSHNQDAWHRFIRQLVLILDAMLADMLAHMQAETERLPRWHPKRIAMRRLHADFTRMRDAWTSLSVPDDTSDRTTVPPAPHHIAGLRPARAPFVHPSPSARPASRAHRCTTSLACQPPHGGRLCTPILFRFRNYFRFDARKSAIIRAGSGERQLSTKHSTPA